jgi:hypothetical protein
MHESHDLPCAHMGKVEAQLGKIQIKVLLALWAYPEMRR